MTPKHHFWQCSDQEISHLPVCALRKHTFLVRIFQKYVYIFVLFDKITNMQIEARIFYWQTSFYVVLSCAGSLPLSRMLQSCPTNSGHDLQIIVNGIANGLAHLHSMSVLHNHLVCDNISLVAGGDAHCPC